MVFILSALWWRRIRGLRKLPDGRDWLRGKLGLVLMGGAMLSKSLIQFSVDGRSCFPSLLFDLRPNYGGGNYKTLAPWKKSYDQPRQHFKKQRHYFANKGLFSQNYGFSSSHVWMWVKWSESFSVMSVSLQALGLNAPWNSLGQNTGVGSLSLLQRIFPTQGLNPGLPHCKWILYQLSHKGSPWMWELDYKESWVPKNWCFWTVVLEKTLQSPLDYKEIQPVHPKGNKSWVFIGRTDAEAEILILWPPDGKNWLTGKDSDVGKDWRQEEKGTTEDEMVGWHHRLDGHEFEWTPGVGDGQGGMLQSMGLQRVRYSRGTELN